jgi:exodeoxyribonuclease VII large subunit
MHSVASPQSALSVTELTAGIRQLLEQSFAHIRVIGEVSRLTRHASGHIYFTIKDQHASISAVIWRSDAVRLRVLPQEGGEFIFAGHLSVYEPRGTYQLIVRTVEEAGSGRLAAEFERRKQLFTERGWFDPGRKRPLPSLPKHIGIITSPSTAAIEDVKKVLATRPAWLQLTLAPCLVQGDAAPASIADAFARMGRMASPPDIILLVRGGGSVEDLWCFNDEQVVRAIVDSPIPVISGIGHEIDVTLADFAADVRAATPSNAAEIACPAREELRRQLPRLPLLHGLLAKTLSHAAEIHAGQQARMRHAMRLALDGRHLHVERLLSRSEGSIRQAIRLQRDRLGQACRRLEPLEPRLRMHRQRQQLARMQRRLVQGLGADITAARQRVQHHRLPVSLAASRSVSTCRRRLDRLQQALQPRALTQIERRTQLLRRQHDKMLALDPMHVLQRGFTLATTPDGLILHSVSQVRAGTDIAVRFHDGTADARVTRTEETR